MRTAAEVMLTTPARHPLSATVGEILDFFRDDHLDTDLVALIAALRQQSYKVGLLSNDAVTLEDKLRRELKIYDAFDAVVISAAIGAMKPDRAAYDAIAQALDVPLAACVFIDDNVANVEGATD